MRRYPDQWPPHLPLGSAARGDILREVLSHLDESAQELRRPGSSAVKSEEAALGRFGYSVDLGGEIASSYDGGRRQDAAPAAAAFLAAFFPAGAENLENALLGTASAYVCPATLLVLVAVSMLAWRRRLPLGATRGSA